MIIISRAKPRSYRDQPPGIGHAIAHGLAEAGASVIVNGRTQERVQRAVEKIKAAVPKADVKGLCRRSWDQMTARRRLIAQVPAADILINNLGIFEPKPFFDIPDEDWERFFRVNVLSGVRLRGITHAAWWSASGDE